MVSQLPLQRTPLCLLGGCTLGLYAATHQVTEEVALLFAMSSRCSRGTAAQTRQPYLWGSGNTVQFYAQCEKV